MPVSKRFMSVAIASALVTTTACVTDPETGQRSISKAAIGAALGGIGGYFAGDLIGGRRDRTEKILGAGIGAVAGGAIGVYMDRQERELREKTAGTGVEVIREGDEIALRMPSGITFAFNRFDIQPQFQTTLNEVAETLRNYPSTYIDIYGHTDNVGSDAYNMTLSQNRAQSVSSYLVARGVQSARVATQGFGESQPIADNSTEAGRAANRRVEIRIVPIENTTAG
jgi:outer membrane protein OmpA-like peptidoglycan-associated protein